ncbi:hypothetical protein CCY01nite_48420 [Chitinophaga cymbidii]|uniref:Uncharacterized protein n=2 Tax=Chitinophaga TaxID=79328 RepID=A0A512RSC2_9BACT|nr:hypothetical protein CCY01nite_48420 [Chitinophaga cymbidii]
MLMWVVRKFPEAWGIYDEDTGFARILDEAEIELIAGEFPQLKDDMVKMILVVEITSIVTGLRQQEPPFEDS